MSSFSNHYANRHTDELVDLARKDLVEEARAALNAEFKLRGISPDQLQEIQAESSAERNYLEQLGSRRKRLLAFKLDLIGVPFALSLPLLPLTLANSGVGNSALVLLWVLYMLFRDSVRGQSIGKRLLGLRVVERDTGHPCTWQRSLVRNATLAIFPIDLLFGLSEERRRLGDRFAGTMVVNT